MSNFFVSIIIILVSINCIIVLNGYVVSLSSLMDSLHSRKLYALKPGLLQRYIEVVNNLENIDTNDSEFVEKKRTLDALISKFSLLICELK